MKPKVFMGSSSEALSWLRRIEAHLAADFTLLTWDQDQVFPSEVTLDALIRIANDVDFAIFIMAADDQVISRRKKGPATRDNVLLEIGLFLGQLERSRVFLLYDEQTCPKVPSDFAGIQLVLFNKELGDADAHSFEGVCKRIAARMTSLGRRGATLAGKRLFQHEGYYPIDLDARTRHPSLNKSTLVKAVSYLLNNRDVMAATDLVYLWESNIGHVPDRFTKHEQKLYEELIYSYDIEKFLNELHDEHENIFQNYKRLVDDIGATLKDVYFEILLHDVRNPLQSIIAARNSENVSNRRVGDPSTRFVVQYVREQGRRLLKALEGQSKVSYLKQFQSNKTVKATTTPIWDHKYGLVGIFCINIDVSAVLSLDEAGKELFFASYIRNSGVTPEFEKDIFL